jgi:hypothetical protein
MAHKYLGNLLVLRTKVGGDIPAGQIELKVRKGRKKPFYLRMSLEEYQRRVVFKSPPATRVKP